MTLGDRNLILLIKQLTAYLRAILDGQQKQIDAIAEYTKTRTQPKETGLLSEKCN